MNDRPRTGMLGWLVAAALLGATPAWADGGGGGGGSGEPDAASAQPAYLKGVAAINDKRWPEAIASLRVHVLANDRHADGHNWLGFAYRKAGQLDNALRHYRRALALDKAHLGAHEYIGEAYLMANQPDEANKHLKRLFELCGSQCEQYVDLERAIAAHGKKP
jgi:tetratricopeptide (TPR) repeat protein